MSIPLKPYPAYKDSGVPWLGAIPAHWEVQRAKWLFQKMNRPVRESDDVVTCFRDGMVTLRKNRRVRGFTESLKEIGYQGIRHGDLVIHAMDAFAGSVGVSDSDGKGSPVYSVCTPAPNANAYYYAYIVREMARNQWILALAKGIRERSTDFRFEGFASQFIPLPPLSEQQSIVAFLTHIDRRITRFIRLKRRMIALLNEQKQAIIHRAVTRGLDPDVCLKPSGVAWLGEVPEHWEIGSLGRFATKRCDGPFGSGLKSTHYTNEGIRVIRLQNIRFAEFRKGDAAYISLEHYASLGDHDVLKNDLLIAGLGDDHIPAGRACVAPADIEPAMVKADCFRFRLNSRFAIPQFVAYQLSTTANIATALLSTGATRQRINLRATASRAIALPSLQDQEAIVGYIVKATQPLDHTIVQIHSEIALISEYRTRLIADVVTGKLDVRDVVLMAEAADDALVGLDAAGEEEEEEGVDEQ